MAEVKWIKLKANIFDNRKIKLIRKLPEGDTIALMWFFLITLAGQINDNGMIYVTKEIPYTTEELAIAFDSTKAIVEGALMTFEKYGMIEIVDNFIQLPSWEKYQNVEGLEKIREQTRKRVQKHRNIKALEDSNVTCNVTVTQSNATDKEEDIDIEKDIDIDIDNKEPLLVDKSKRFIETFKEFKKMRTSIKAKMTPRAEELIISKLNKLSNDEEEQIQILERSIENSWKGVFALPKDNKNGLNKPISSKSEEDYNF